MQRIISISKRSRQFGGNRELAILRDGEKCVSCGISRRDHKVKYSKDITVDHIDRHGINVPANEKNNELNNLQTLCFPCHGRKSSVDKGQPSSLHGTKAMYNNHGCRCVLCRRASAEYMKQYKYKKLLARG